MAEARQPSGCWMCEDCIHAYGQMGPLQRNGYPSQVLVAGACLHLLPSGLEQAQWQRHLEGEPARRGIQEGSATTAAQHAAQEADTQCLAHLAGRARVRAGVLWRPAAAGAAADASPAGGAAAGTSAAGAAAAGAAAGPAAARPSTGSGGTQGTARALRVGQGTGSRMK